MFGAGQQVPKSVAHPLVYQTAYNETKKAIDRGVDLDDFFRGKSQCGDAKICREIYEGAKAAYREVLKREPPERAGDELRRSVRLHGNIEILVQRTDATILKEIARKQLVEIAKSIKRHEIAPKVREKLRAMAEAAKPGRVGGEFTKSARTFTGGVVEHSESEIMEMRPLLNVSGRKLVSTLSAAEIEGLEKRINEAAKKAGEKHLKILTEPKTESKE